MRPFHELDHLHADEDLKEKTLTFITMKATTPLYAKSTTKFAVLSICLCVIAFSLYLFTRQSPPNVSITEPAVAFVSFDINPSMEMQVDENYQVVQAVAYNKDANEILSKLDIKNTPIEEAIAQLLTNVTYADYLKNGMLEVSVYSSDQSIETTLYDEIDTYLKLQLKETQYHCTKVNQKIHERAKQHHTSAGKYQVIEQILSIDPNYQYDQLNDLNMQELYAILKNYEVENDNDAYYHHH